MSDAPFALVILIAEARVEERIWASRFAMHPAEWASMETERRQVIIQRVTDELKHAVSHLTDGYRLFLWDGERESLLAEELLPAPADQGR